jgi:hypothetical protein
MGEASLLETFGISLGRSYSSTSCVETRVVVGRFKKKAMTTRKGYGSCIVCRDTTTS